MSNLSNTVNKPLWLAVMVCLAISIPISVADAQTLTVLHAFRGELDGNDVFAGLARDRAGNLYGTAYQGGTNQPNCFNGCGVVYELSQRNGAWVYTPLYNFTGGSDGYGPRYGVIISGDGSLYGTTVNGGSSNCDTAGCGIVFRLQPPLSTCKTVLCYWRETVLYRFTGGSDGAFPSGNLTFDAAGNLYGATMGGGGNRFCSDEFGCGVVFKLTPSGGSWSLTSLYNFQGGADGEFPQYGVVLDSAGDIFGVNTGPRQVGAIYELTNSGSGYSKSYLYQFVGGEQGSNPTGLVIDAAGNLYGGTLNGGIGGGGTVYELSPSGGSWNIQVLLGLNGTSGPPSPLFRDAAGDLYSSNAPGQFGYGSVFKLSNSNGSWIYSDLYDFTGHTDGAGASGTLVVDGNGNVYGTSAGGGTYGHGVAFEITP